MTRVGVVLCCVVELLWDFGQGVDDRKGSEVVFWDGSKVVDEVLMFVKVPVEGGSVVLF